MFIVAWLFSLLGRRFFHSALFTVSFGRTKQKEKTVRTTILHLGYCEHPVLVKYTHEAAVHYNSRIASSQMHADFNKRHEVSPPPLSPVVCSTDKDHEVFSLEHKNRRSMHAAYCAYYYLEYCI